MADSAGSYTAHFNNANSHTQFEQGTRTDPRTHRWGFMWTRPNGYAYNDYTKNELQGETAASTSITTALAYNPNATSAKAALPSWNGSYATATPALGYSQTNQPTTGPIQQKGSGQFTNATYYQDPDGVIRLADGAYASGTLGLPMYMPSTAVPGSTVVGPVANRGSRPVMLNRPFQSVADLGYVFRDTPWRSLDFFTPQSGDNALLDVFTVYGPDPWVLFGEQSRQYVGKFVNENALVAGRVDLNTAQAPVLAALLQGTLVATPAANSSVMIDSAHASVAANVASALVAWTHATNSASQGPLRNRAELVGKYVSSAGNYSGFSFGDPSKTPAQTTTLLSPLGTDATVIKQQRECVVRALADVGTTRTWNVLIDVVAQTGRLASNARGLQDFIVTGEKHQWVSVAIDRVTGKVIKMQAEPVRS